MKLLLTGFEPYGAVEVNPSEQVVRRIAERAQRRGSDDLITEILPTEFIAAGQRIRKLIRKFRPEAVLCLGVAPKRDKISLERVALNLDDDALPDNAGRVREGRQIVPGGPVAYWSTLPLVRIRKRLEKRGIPASCSNHAGTYLCNHVFYITCHEMQRKGHRSRCGLVHVPPLRQRGKKAQPRGLPLGKMVEAVECCLDVLRKA